ncbi:MAG: HAD-IA family hydrolase, partial [Chitinophagaceae bacterium]|nr:HAD-IA family hydrolase [Chitinophagaceae bacterium]
MSKEKNITTLFCDIGGVLLSNGWGHDFRQKAADRFHLDKEEMEDRHSIMFVTYEEGRITLDEYLNRVIFNKKRDFSIDEFRDFMFSLTTPHEDMIAFIKKIKQQYNLKIVAVSNEARELNAYRINTFKLNTFIDFFVSSCYVHIRKPDARIFKLALDMSQVPENEVVYIDDVQMFVDVATDFGIQSICHKDYLSTGNVLAAFG